MEGIEPVTEALWPRVCVAPELRGLPKAERESAATLVFSAKTAFYKCLYTVSRAWLVFSDMQIDIDGSDLSAGRFVIGVVDPQYREIAGLSACQVFSDRKLIVACVAWPRA